MKSDTKFFYEYQEWIDKKIPPEAAATLVLATVLNQLLEEFKKSNSDSKPKKDDDLKKF